MKRYFLFCLLLLLCTVDTLTARTCYLFIGSYNFNRNKEGIFVYRFDTETGALQKVSATRDIPNPSYITISPDGRYIYACTETQTKKAGSVSSFLFDSSKGMLSLINSRKSEGENPVYVSVNNTGKWLANANYTEGSISMYPLADNGSILPVKQVIKFEEGSADLQRQDRSHVHSAVFSPAQDYIFFPDLGADKIRCYAFDPSRPEPLSVPQYPVTSSVPGSGPRHFTFHPNGCFAYCIEELSGYVSVYSYANGRLDSIQRISTHDKERINSPSSADIHISPDGRFLYASNRSNVNNLAIYSVNEQTGQLTLIGYQSVHGNHPRSFVIDPTGNFLLVANQISGNVVVFKRDIKTGLLTKTPNHIKILSPSSLQMRFYED